MQSLGGLRSLIPSLAQILLLSAILQIVALATPFYMQLVVDEVLVKHDADLLTLLGAGFLVLGLAPVLAVLVVVQVLRRAGNYAIMRPAREMLYVVLAREEKYKAKNFIDTVVYRSGDALSGWAFAGLRALGLGLSAIAWIAVPLAVLWAWVAYRLGQAQTHRAQTR